MDKLDKAFVDKMEAEIALSFIRTIGLYDGVPVGLVKLVIQTNDDLQRITGLHGWTLSHPSYDKILSTLGDIPYIKDDKGQKPTSFTLDTKLLLTDNAIEDLRQEGYI